MRLHHYGHLFIILLIAIIIWPNSIVAQDSLFVTDDGRVGIGTSYPNFRLEVNGGRIAANDGSGSAIFSSNAEAGNDYIEVHSGASDSIQFILNNIERMHIDQNSNIGIGTTNPIDKLHIADGGIRLENLYGIAFSERGPLLLM